MSRLRSQWRVLGTISFNNKASRLEGLDLVEGNGELTYQERYHSRRGDFHQQAAMPVREI